MGRCLPYLIYLDHHHRELVLRIRGLNLAHERDYYILLDNRVSMQTFGFMNAAAWLLDQESEAVGGERIVLPIGVCRALAWLWSCCFDHPTRVESPGEVRRATSATVAPARCVSGHVFRCHQLRRVKGSSILFAAFATVN